MFSSSFHQPRVQLSRTALSACIGLTCLAAAPTSVPAVSSLPASANPASNATAAPSPASGQEASPAAGGTASMAKGNNAQSSVGKTTEVAAAISQPPSAATQPPPAKGGASAQTGSPSPANMAQIADTCANCHGPDEQHPADGIPSLFGQPAARLRDRMRAFRQGQTPDGTVMPRLMKGIGEAEIDALADWFAAGGRQAQTGGAAR